MKNRESLIDKTVTINERKYNRQLKITRLHGTRRHKVDCSLVDDEGRHVKLKESWMVDLDAKEAMHVGHAFLCGYSDEFDTLQTELTVLISRRRRLANLTLVERLKVLFGFLRPYDL